MKTLVLTNQKGGVGKSALCALLAFYLGVTRGQRVLVIDLDHQATLTNLLRKSHKAALAAVSAHQVLTDPAAEVEAAPIVLVASHEHLKTLESQREQHNQFAMNLRAFLRRVGAQFDFCLIDTNPNPDIRVVSALVSTDFVLSPIQLAQSSIDGIAGLLNDKRAGLVRIKELLNPRLQFLGMLPMMVEPTPRQRENFRRVMANPGYRKHLLAMVDEPAQGKDYAAVPRRVAFQAMEATGVYMAEMKDNTAARDTWREVRPVMDRVAQLMGVA